MTQVAGTGLGICHAIGHALGGRFDIAHGVAILTGALDGTGRVQPTRAARPGPDGG
jgi:hypothetical protein